MSRREFTSAVAVQIVKRATVNGVVRCEECHGVAMRHQIDHIDPDALQIDKSRKLTADDGQLLCIPCHAEKTKQDVANIAKAKRREAAHLGAKLAPKQKIASAPFPKTKPTREPRVSLAPRPLYR